MPNAPLYRSGLLVANHADKTSAITRQNFPDFSTSILRSRDALSCSQLENRINFAMDCGVMDDGERASKNHGLGVGCGTDRKRVAGSGGFAVRFGEPLVSGCLRPLLSNVPHHVKAAGGRCLGPSVAKVMATTDRPVAVHHVWTPFDSGIMLGAVGCNSRVVASNTPVVSSPGIDGHKGRNVSACSVVALPVSDSYSRLPVCTEAGLPGLTSQAEASGGPAHYAQSNLSMRVLI